MTSAVRSTVGECLRDLLVGTADDAKSLFEGCGSFLDEFKRIRKKYLKRACRVHPDKGGDPAEFRRVQVSFETLKKLFDKGAVSSFASRRLKRLRNNGAICGEKIFPHLLGNFTTRQRKNSYLDML